LINKVGQGSFNCCLHSSDLFWTDFHYFTARLTKKLEKNALYLFLVFQVLSSGLNALFQPKNPHFCEITKIGIKYTVANPLCKTLIALL
jgi:hypothetical protein